MLVFAWDSIFYKNDGLRKDEETVPQRRQLLGFILQMTGNELSSIRIHHHFRLNMGVWPENKTTTTS